MAVMLRFKSCLFNLFVDLLSSSSNTTIFNWQLSEKKWLKCFVERIVKSIVEIIVESVAESVVYERCTKCVSA